MATAALTWQAIMCRDHALDTQWKSGAADATPTGDRRWNRDAYSF
ncbi:hypothetical protein [Sphingosinicella sp. BN140058]|nr:hypothetical protein [Sphingosinicella sp. BN140058]